MLAHNSFVFVPVVIAQLCNLRELNLAGNRLSQFNLDLRQCGIINYIVWILNDYMRDDGVSNDNSIVNSELNSLDIE